MTVTGFSAYDPKPANFRATFTKIKGQNPDAIFIGGLVDENSGQLINDKVAILGPNNGTVKLMLPDGFTTDAIFHRRRWYAEREGRVLQRRGRRHRQVQGSRADVHRRLQGRPSTGSRSTRTRSSAPRPARSC